MQKTALRTFIRLSKLHDYMTCVVFYCRAQRIGPKCKNPPNPEVRRVFSNLRGGTRKQHLKVQSDVAKMAAPRQVEGAMANGIYRHPK